MEFWKRKCCEINYRWGQLELMNNPEELEREVKDDFVGDDEISSNTGELDKHYTQFKTVIIYIFFLNKYINIYIYIFMQIFAFFLIFSFSERKFM